MLCLISAVDQSDSILYIQCVCVCIYIYIERESTVLYILFLYVCTHCIYSFPSWFPGGSDGKACNARDPDSILGWEDPLEKEMATLLQYSCLENSTDGGGWWVIVHGVAKSWT